MAYELSMGDDGILRTTYIGDIGNEDVESYFRDFGSFIETATEAEPLLFLTDVSRMGKVCVEHRKRSVELLGNPRIEKSAVVGANRYSRLLGSFMMKVSGNDSVRYFDSEEEALAWLKAES